MRTCAIIPNYNGYFHTIVCVRSLQRCSLPLDVVIVENTDDAADLSLLNSFVNDASSVEILIPGQNLGYGGAINYAAKAVEDRDYKHYLIMNNDIWVPFNTIRLLEETLVNRGLDMVAPIIYGDLDPLTVWSKGNYYNHYLATVSPVKLFPNDFFYLTGCCLLIKKEVFHELSGFEGDFFMYGEDVHLCFRMLRDSYRYGVAESAWIYHLVNQSSQTASLFYEYHINRSHLLLTKKIAESTSGARLSFITVVFMLALRAVKRHLWGWSDYALSGYLQALRCNK